MALVVGPETSDSRSRCSRGISNITSLFSIGNLASLAKLVKGVMTKLLLGTYCNSRFPWQSTLMFSYCVVVLTGPSCPVSHLSCGERG